MKIGPDMLPAQLDALRQGQSNWYDREQTSSQPDLQVLPEIAGVETEAANTQQQDPANELLLMKLWQEGQAGFEPLGPIPANHETELSGWANRLADFILA